MLDMINETALTNSTLLEEMKDLIYNIKADVKEIQQLREGVEETKTELTRHKKRN